jgi:hypothetical protein
MMRNIHESPSGGPFPRLEPRRVDGTTPSSHETLGGVSVGQAVIVVHYDSLLNGVSAQNPQIAVIREKQTKASSGRQKGQLGIPIETRKKGEESASNIWGALAELYDDQTLPRGHLFFVVNGFGSAVLEGSLVDLTVLVYDGPKDAVFNPTCGEEVGFGGWMSMADFLQAEDGRGIAQHLARTARNKGIIRAALENYSIPGMKIPVFPDGFSMQAFYEARERLEDVSFSLVSEAQ